MASTYWRENFSRILNSAAPGDDFAAALAADPVGAPVFLRLAPQISAGPKPFHSGSVLRHISRCMNETAGDPRAVWLALCHDAGKLTTPLAMLPHHYGHELRGRLLAPIWARELGLSPKWGEYGVFMALQHMRAARFPLMRAGKKYRLLNLLADFPWRDPFWAAVDADCRAPLGAYAAACAGALSYWRAAGLSPQKQIEALAAFTGKSNKKIPNGALK